jgi:hypothetical protein
MALKNPGLWLTWSAVMIGMAGILTYRLTGPDRRLFLPGATSRGHHQIELACHVCHTPWMGVNEKSCYDCHAAELRAANDSHPKSKFTDPRNADRLKLVRADNCVACHREHLPEQTRAMGVTMPEDYCYHCHQQTLKDRPSHREFAFNSCATAGCHNYHDNTALYEGFLLKHADEPNFKEPAVRPQRDPAAFPAAPGRGPQVEPLSVERADAPREVDADAGLRRDWSMSAHAKGGVNCGDCHARDHRAARSNAWANRVDHAACASCHPEEADGFLEGMHGMRLARGLTPMKPALARLPMKRGAAERELSCVSCHGAHRFDPRSAAVEACLSCHDDEHSLAYQASAHFSLWRDELAGKAPPGTGVSCATCHLPREVLRSGDGPRVIAQHNQNDNLRPNEKMIRGVCLDCHGLAFSLDALADPALVRANFIGRPSGHVESIDLAVRRQMELQRSTTKP